MVTKRSRTRETTPPRLPDVEQTPVSDFAQGVPRLLDVRHPRPRTAAPRGLSATAKFKKSARTVGDVIGEFHPHGDSACYEAMVLMAQPFSLRYPLIDGQGNWGSPDDPKSFAAMRYTESRLTRFAQTLLSELEQGTTEWGQNFDGTLREPKLMPSRFIITALPYQVSGSKVLQQIAAQMQAKKLPISSAHHHPHDEDRAPGDPFNLMTGITNVHWQGVDLEPHNLFDFNPLGAPSRSQCQ